jgi:hypothetical protein
MRRTTLGYGFVIGIFALGGACTKDTLVGTGGSVLEPVPAAPATPVVPPTTPVPETPATEPPDLQPTAARPTPTTIQGRADEITGTQFWSAGDLDGDGYDDFVIESRPAFEPGQNYSMRSTFNVFYGRAPFPAELTMADAAATIVNWNDDEVNYATRLGDVNGDGLSDFVITGPSWSQIVLGSRQRLQGKLTAKDIGIRWQGVIVADELQNGADTLVVLPAGDVNGDGIDDLFAGAVNVPALTGVPGIAVWTSYLYLGHTGAWETWSFDSKAAVAVFGPQDPRAPNGPSVDSPTPQAAGDLDGDGCSDVLQLGSLASVRLYYGGAGTLTGTLTRERAGAIFEVHASLGYQPLPDLDGDGIDELVISRFESNLGITYGRKDRWSGKLQPVADLIVVPPPERVGEVAFGGASGGHVGLTVGDVNSDGFPDLLVGDTRESVLYVIPGTGKRWTGTLNVQPEHEWLRGMRIERMDELGLNAWDSDGLGTSVDARGDFDGDGNLDVLVGVPGTRQAHAHVAGWAGGQVLAVLGKKGTPF